MGENTSNRKSFTSRFLTLGILFALCISSYSLFKVMTLQPGQKTTIVPGVTVQKPERSVQDTYVSDNNELVVVYSDGSTKNLGSYKGRDGENGVSASISNVDVQQAVEKYCANGRCDAKKPTPEVVLASVLDACGGNCKGANGKDAPAVTNEQIYAQVLSYCSDGKCKGDTGATGASGLNGLNGVDGHTQQLACIITTENNTTVRYYSAKYTDEPDSAYLTWAYRTRLPNWFQPNDCIDMRSA
jgi:hypothetical protein